MSIATQTGDDGTTALLFGRRVSKADPLIECNGVVDELNAVLGMARAVLKNEASPQAAVIGEAILSIQKELVTLMGEIAVLEEDRDRHRKAGYGTLTEAHVERLTTLVRDLEKNSGLTFKGWAIPGETLAGATLDVARTVCRRAERAVAALDNRLNKQILRYLNRLSDLCWLWARWVETDAKS